MAVRQVSVDDIDGSEDDVRLVRFSFDGRDYEVDLSAGNREALTGLLAPFVAAARQVGKGPSKAAAPSAPVRQWARSNGIAVPDRGRIPKNVMDAYVSEHPHHG